MSAELCLTEDPEFVLVKEYETKPDINDLTELYIVVTMKEIPNWQKTGDEDEDFKKAAQLYFFTKFDKAFKRFKLLGPTKGALKRIVTDDERLINLAHKNDNIFVEVPPEEEFEVIRVHDPTLIPELNIEKEV
jgi:hypothetical protein